MLIMYLMNNIFLILIYKIIFIHFIFYIIKFIVQFIHIK